MITPNDIQALRELLGRTLMTTAETLYATDLLARLAALVLPPAAPATPPQEKEPAHAESEETNPH